MIGLLFGGALLKTVIAGALIAIAVAGLAYLAVKVTVSFLRKYKQKKQSQLVMANMGSLIKAIPDKEKRTYSFDDLENIKDETIVAEYDNDGIIVLEVGEKQNMLKKFIFGAAKAISTGVKGIFMKTTDVLKMLISLAIAGLVYLSEKVTVSSLKKYLRNKKNKLIMARMGSLIKSIPDKEKGTFSFDDLDNIKDEIIMAEYGEESDEIIQANFVGEQGLDENINTALEQNDGVILIEG